MKRGETKLLFYDFEVFKYDWLVVIMDTDKHDTKIIVNDRDELQRFYSNNKKNIWVGFNSRGYDQYILKGILCGFNPKDINDYIIVTKEPGWKYSKLLKDIPLINYDVMEDEDKGLKLFELYMGHNIKESDVSFDIDRKLTEDEIRETIEYCKHDVEETVEIFLKRKNDFVAHMELIKMFNLPLSDLNKTKVQLSAEILEAKRRRYDDEFDLDLPNTMIIDKYIEVVDWYSNEENYGYTHDTITTKVFGVEHSFGWGGLHGAIPKYHEKGHFVNMDVTSLYPSLMIQYDLLSRSCKKDKYIDIYNKRIEYKAAKNPQNVPLKLVLNGTFGASKDYRNPLYDPRQANRICIYGQLLLLDLIEKLEDSGRCKLIQSNTDGILIKLNDYDDYDLIDDIAYQWEKRTGLKLEFEEYVEVFQKDVNNYIVIDKDGNYKSKGAYVKKLNELDCDLKIVNDALVNYMVHKIPIEETIYKSDKLMDFQMACKITKKFTRIMHGETPLKERIVRCFASIDKSDGGLYKISARTGKPNKISNTPTNCFIENGYIAKASTSDYPKLDKQWYINLANKRLKDFLG